MQRTWLALTFGGLAVAACTVPAEDPAMQPPGWVGCYVVESGSWTPAPHPSNLPYHTPPDRIELDSATVELPHASGVKRLSPFLAVRSGPLEPSAYWRAVGPDSALLAWSTGLAGVNLRVAKTAAGFAGIARAWTDVVLRPGEARPEAPIIGTRVGC